MFGNESWRHFNNLQFNSFFFSEKTYHKWNNQVTCGVILNKTRVPKFPFALFLTDIHFSSLFSRSNCSAWLSCRCDGELGSDHIQGDGAALRPSQILCWKQGESYNCNRPWTCTHGTHKLAAKWPSSTTVYLADTGSMKGSVGMSMWRILNHIHSLEGGAINAVNKMFCLCSQPSPLQIRWLINRPGDKLTLLSAHIYFKSWHFNKWC